MAPPLSTVAVRRSAQVVRLASPGPLGLGLTAQSPTRSHRRWRLSVSVSVYPGGSGLFTVTAQPSPWGTAARPRGEGREGGAA